MLSPWLSFVVVTVMVELLLRISLMTMWLVIVAFLQLFRSFDVAAGVVVIFFYCCCPSSSSAVIRSQQGNSLVETFHGLQLRCMILVLRETGRDRVSRCACLCVRVRARVFLCVCVRVSAFCIHARSSSLLAGQA